MLVVFSFFYTAPEHTQITSTMLIKLLSLRNGSLCAISYSQFQLIHHNGRSVIANHMMTSCTIYTRAITLFDCHYCQYIFLRFSSILSHNYLWHEDSDIGLLAPYQHLREEAGFFFCYACFKKIKCLTVFHSQHTKSANRKPLSLIIETLLYISSNHNAQSVNG
jgi:hypothetical protein